MKTLQEQPEKIGKFFPLPHSDAAPRSPDGLRVSEREYWEKYYEYVGDNDHIFEWNDGVLEERPMSDHQSYLMFEWFYPLLREYLITNPVAEIFGTDMGFRLPLPHKTVIRRPDLSLVLNTNPVRFAPSDRSYAGIFDICLEFLSDSTKKDIERDTVEKKSEYSHGGVREYFILDRLGRETAFYHMNRRGFYSPIRPVRGGVIRSGVLPGFQFREQDLYTRPSFRQLADDPVYSPFVLKDWQDERSKAEDERKRANEAEEKARNLAEKLRELGIDPENF